MSTITYSSVKDSASSRGINIIRKILVAALWLLGGLVVAISALPTFLLSGIKEIFNVRWL